MSEITNEVFSNVTAKPQIRFRHRLMWYGATWFLAYLVFQVFLPLDGPTVTDLTPWQQRILLPVQTPLLSWIGLSMAMNWPQLTGDAAILALLAAFLWIVILAIICLTRTGLRSVVAALAVQIVTLSVAAIYFIRFAKLPGGG